jgi:hypothetical protein
MFMGDCEDPYLMAAFPLKDWENSEQGQQVMSMAVEKPVFYVEIDPARMGYKIKIYAKFTEEDAVLYLVKHGLPGA